MRRSRLTNQASFDEAYLSLAKEPSLDDQSLYETACFTVRHCADSLQASRVSIWLMSDDQSTLSCLCLYDKDRDRIESGAQLQADLYPQYFDALRNHRFVDAADALNDPRTAELKDGYLEPFNVGALIDTTLRQQGNLRGVLCAEIVGAVRAWTTPEQHFVASVADFVMQRIISAELSASQRYHQALFDGAMDGIMVLTDGKFSDVNPSVCGLFGATREELLGRSPIEMSPEKQRDGALSSEKAMGYISACLAGLPQHFEWTHRRIDGSTFDADIALNVIDSVSEDTLFALVRDVSAAKEAERAAAVAQKQMEYRASHDSLTGLWNREQLHKHVDGLIAQSEGTGARLALFLLDLNRFKEINDTLGHGNGDRVLVKLAEVLRQDVESCGGALFRLGGDEFVAVLTNTHSNVDFGEMEKRLLASSRTTIDVDDISVELGASLGVSVFPENGHDSFELLRCADVAMYHAKHNDGATAWYATENDMNNKRRLAMMVELGTGIRDGHLRLCYQPKVDLARGEVTGLEALVRWEHPKLGMVPPGEFIPLAEAGELISPLTQWVLGQACDDSKKLRAMGHRLPVAINLSARSLTDRQFFKGLESLLVSESMPPGWLEIEITESALINHPQRAVANLERINKLGVAIAIDDFGTGYSSLSYLKQLPLQTLKIDRSFVMDMLEDESDSVIVDSTITLAHNFSLTVVAEGVEDQETLDALKRKGCDQAQGFFIARPMPAEELDAWLRGYYDARFFLAKAG